MCDDGLYAFEDIIAKRVDPFGHVEYLIKWVGYGPEHNTWEPEMNIPNKKFISLFNSEIEKCNTSTFNDEKKGAPSKGLQRNSYLQNATRNNSEPKDGCCSWLGPKSNPTTEAEEMMQGDEKLSICTRGKQALAHQKSVHSGKLAASNEEDSTQQKQGVSLNRRVKLPLRHTNVDFVEGESRQQNLVSDNEPNKIVKLKTSRSPTNGTGEEKGSLNQKPTIVGSAQKTDRHVIAPLRRSTRITRQSTVLQDTNACSELIRCNTVQTHPRAVGADLQITNVKPKSGKTDKSKPKNQPNNTKKVAKVRAKSVTLFDSKFVSTGDIKSIPSKGAKTVHLQTAKVIPQQNTQDVSSMWTESIPVQIVSQSPNEYHPLLVKKAAKAVRPHADATLIVETAYECRGNASARSVISSGEDSVTSPTHEMSIKPKKLKLGIVPVGMMGCVVQSTDINASTSLAAEFTLLTSRQEKRGASSGEWHTVGGCNKQDTSPSVATSESVDAVRPGKGVGASIPLQGSEVQMFGEPVVKAAGQVNIFKDGSESASVERSRERNLSPMNVCARVLCPSIQDMANEGVGKMNAGGLIPSKEVLSLDHSRNTMSWKTSKRLKRTSLEESRSLTEQTIIEIFKTAGTKQLIRSQDVPAKTVGKDLPLTVKPSMTRTSKKIPLQLAPSLVVRGGKKVVETFHQDQVILLKDSPPATLKKRLILIGEKCDTEEVVGPVHGVDSCQDNLSQGLLNQEVKIPIITSMDGSLLEEINLVADSHWGSEEALTVEGEVGAVTEVSSVGVTRGADVEQSRLVGEDSDSLGRCIVRMVEEQGTYIEDFVQLSDLKHSTPVMRQQKDHSQDNVINECTLQGTNNAGIAQFPDLPLFSEEMLATVDFDIPTAQARIIETSKQGDYGKEGVVGARWLCSDEETQTASDGIMPGPAQDLFLEISSAGVPKCGEGDRKKPEDWLDEYLSSFFKSGGPQEDCLETNTTDSQLFTGEVVVGPLSHLTRKSHVSSGPMIQTPEQTERVVHFESDIPNTTMASISIPDSCFVPLDSDLSTLSAAMPIALLTSQTSTKMSFTPSTNTKLNLAPITGASSMGITQETMPVVATKMCEIERSTGTPTGPQLSSPVECTRRTASRLLRTTKQLSCATKSVVVPSIVTEMRFVNNIAQKSRALTSVTHTVTNTETKTKKMPSFATETNTATSVSQGKTIVVSVPPKPDVVTRLVQETIPVPNITQASSAGKSVTQTTSTRPRPQVREQGVQQDLAVVNVTQVPSASKSRTQATSTRQRAHVREESVQQDLVVVNVTQVPSGRKSVTQAINTQPRAHVREESFQQDLVVVNVTQVPSASKSRTQTTSTRPRAHVREESVQQDLAVVNVTQAPSASKSVTQTASTRPRGHIREESVQQAPAVVNVMQKPSTRKSVTQTASTLTRPHIREKSIQQDPATSAKECVTQTTSTRTLLSIQEEGVQHDLSEGNVILPPGAWIRVMQMTSTRTNPNILEERVQHGLSEANAMRTPTARKSIMQKRGVPHTTRTRPCPHIRNESVQQDPALVNVMQVASAMKSLTQTTSTWPLLNIREEGVQQDVALVNCTQAPRGITQTTTAQPLFIDRDEPIQNNLSEVKFTQTPNARENVTQITDTRLRPCVREDRVQHDFSEGNVMQTVNARKSVMQMASTRTSPNIRKECVQYGLSEANIMQTVNARKSVMQTTGTQPHPNFCKEDVKPNLPEMTPNARINVRQTTGTQPHPNFCKEDVKPNLPEMTPNARINVRQTTGTQPHPNFCKEDVKPNLPEMTPNARINVRQTTGTQPHPNFCKEDVKPNLPEMTPRARINVRQTTDTQPHPNFCKEDVKPNLPEMTPRARINVMQMTGTQPHPNVREEGPQHGQVAKKSGCGSKEEPNVSLPHLKSPDVHDLSPTIANPWWTTECSRLARRKKKAFHRWRRDRTQANAAILKTMQQQCRYTLRHAKSSWMTSTDASVELQKSSTSQVPLTPVSCFAPTDPGSVLTPMQRPNRKPDCDSENKTIHTEPRKPVPLLELRLTPPTNAPPLFPQSAATKAMVAFQKPRPVTQGAGFKPSSCATKCQRVLPSDMHVGSMREPQTLSVAPLQASTYVPEQFAAQVPSELEPVSGNLIVSVPLESTALANLQLAGRPEPAPLTSVCPVACSAVAHDILVPEQSTLHTEDLRPQNLTSPGWTRPDFTADTFWGVIHPRPQGHGHCPLPFGPDNHSHNRRAAAHRPRGLLAGRIFRHAGPDRWTPPRFSTLGPSSHQSSPPDDKCNISVPDLLKSIKQEETEDSLSTVDCGDQGESFGEAASKSHTVAARQNNWIALKNTDRTVLPRRKKPRRYNKFASRYEDSSSSSDTDSDVEILFETQRRSVSYELANKDVEAAVKDPQLNAPVIGDEDLRPHTAIGDDPTCPCEGDDAPLPGSMFCAQRDKVPNPVASMHPQQSLSQSATFSSEQAQLCAQLDVVFPLEEDLREAPHHSQQRTLFCSPRRPLHQEHVSSPQRDVPCTNQETQEYRSGSVATSPVQQDVLPQTNVTRERKYSSRPTSQTGVEFTEEKNVGDAMGASAKSSRATQGGQIAVKMLDTPRSGNQLLSNGRCTGDADRNELLSTKYISCHSDVASNQVQLVTENTHARADASGHDTLQVRDRWSDKDHKADDLPDVFTNDFEAKEITNDIASVRITHNSLGKMKNIANDKFSKCPRSEKPGTEGDTKEGSGNMKRRLVSDDSHSLNRKRLKTSSDQTSTTSWLEHKVSPNATTEDRAPKPFLTEREDKELAPFLTEKENKEPKPFLTERAAMREIKEPIPFLTEKATTKENKELKPFLTERAAMRDDKESKPFLAEKVTSREYKRPKPIVIKRSTMREDKVPTPLPTEKAASREYMGPKPVGIKRHPKVPILFSTYERSSVSSQCEQVASKGLSQSSPIVASGLLTPADRCKDSISAAEGIRIPVAALCVDTDTGVHSATSEGRTERAKDVLGKPEEIVNESEEINDELEHEVVDSEERLATLRPVTILGRDETYFYMVKEDRGVAMIPAREANGRWPQMVIRFYEEHIFFGTCD